MRQSPISTLDGFVDRLSEPVIAIDGSFRVAAASPAAVALFGRQRKVRGTRCSALLGGHSARAPACCQDCAPVGRSPYIWSDSKAVGQDGALAVTEGQRVRCIVGGTETTLIFLKSAASDGAVQLPARAVDDTQVMSALLDLTDWREAAGIVVDNACRTTDASFSELRVASDGDLPPVLGPAGHDGPPCGGSLEAAFKQTAARTIASRTPVVEAMARPVGIPGSWAVDWRLISVPLLARGQALGALSVAGPSDRLRLGPAISRLFHMAGVLSLYLRGAGPEALPAAPRPAGRVMRINTLGRFEVNVGGRTVPPAVFKRRASLQLLKLIAASEGCSIGRAEAAEILWPESPPDAAAAALRVALHGLRRVCGTPGAAESSASPVRSDPERIYLEAGAYQLDADEFQAARRKCLEMSQLGLTAEAIRAGQAAAGLYGGQFMAGDVYSEWCSGRRTEMNEMFIDLVLQLGALLVSEGRWSDAAHAYRRATIASPESEVAARGFMRAAWKSGRALDALNEYSRLASALWSGHRTRPSAETKAVRDEIARSIETAAGSGPAPAASAGHVTTSKSRSGARL